MKSVLLREAVGLLTLTGPGGIGKTRLALQVAADLLDHFVDGVYFVSLAPIRDPNLVGEAVAQVLGVHETPGQALLASLHEHLADKQMLLVLDNFEQVTAAGASVAELLAQCRQLKVLATSRTKLHLYGEYEYSVPLLALPRMESTDTANGEALAAVAAVALFVQKAREVEPEFALNAANGATVAAICIELEGLPLAIELAAAKLKLFSPPALLARLQSRLALLTGGPHDAPLRQRTLRDEIAWSYDLLASAEQALFRWLAIFAGGFTLEAAETVGNGAATWGITVLDGLAVLVDHNLVKRSEGGEQGDGELRFDMLETIREYGLEQLATSGEMETIHRLHAGYYTALAETFSATPVSLAGETLLKRLRSEHANLRVALAWSQGQAADPEFILRLVVALSDFWMMHAYWSEARHWMEYVLTLTIPVELAVLEAQALVGAGCMAVMLNDGRRAREKLEQGMALARELALSRLVAQALTYLSFVAHQYEHDDAKANSQLEQVMVIGRAIGDKSTMAESLLFRGGLARDAHDYRRSQALCEEALTLYREMGTVFGISDTLSFLGQVAQLQHDHAQAWRYYRESLAGLQALGTFAWKGVAACLEGLASICATERQVEAAAQLLGASEALLNILGIATPATAGSPAADKLAALRAQMDEGAFTAAWAKGRALAPQQAVEYALALGEAPPMASAPAAAERAVNPLRLTNREIEVLRLLAQGLTYAEIAAQLVVTHRTVNGHVSSIYSKLGANNRAAATRFAAMYKLI